METTLHQQLKCLFASDPSQVEVTLGDYRIDAVRDDELIEVQCASLSALRAKSQQLLQRHKLRIVKPVIGRTRIAKAKSKTSPITARRWSPKRGGVLDLFDELIYFTKVFPHPNLTLDVPVIEVQQTRIPRRRKRRRGPDYQVLDVALESIQQSFQFRDASDLLRVLPGDWDQGDFNTEDLAKRIGRPRWQAQRIAYVLRETGAIDVKVRNRSGIVYARAAG